MWLRVRIHQLRYQHTTLPPKWELYLGRAITHDQRLILTILIQMNNNTLYIALISILTWLICCIFILELSLTACTVLFVYNIDYGQILNTFKGVSGCLIKGTFTFLNICLEYAIVLVLCYKI